MLPPVGQVVNIPDLEPLLKPGARRQRVMQLHAESPHDRQGRSIRHMILATLSWSGWAYRRR